MIHQPDHLLGVVVYGLMSLIAFGFGLVRLKGTKGARRTAWWLLVCMGVGQGLYAADEWHWATLLPPKTYQHGLLYNIGSAFIAVSLFSLLWTSFKSRARTGDEVRPKPTQH